MSSATSFLLRRLQRWQSWLVIGFAVVLFGTLLATLLMTSDALQSSARFESVYTWLLIANVLALLALFMLVGLNVRQLFSQVRHRRVGSRLTLRIVSLLVVLSIMPVGIVYYFALEFINQRLDSWFNVEVERGMETALALSKASMGALVRESSRQMESASHELTLIEEDISALHLDAWRERMGAYELNLLTTNGKVLIASIADTNQLLPSRPNENILLHMQNKPHYAGFEGFGQQSSMVTTLTQGESANSTSEDTIASNNSDSFRIRVVSRLRRPSLDRAKQEYLLHGVFIFSSRISELGETLTHVFEAYRKRAFLHEPLKLSFTLVLSLVLLLGIFSAIWVAIFSTRRLVAPLSELVEGTRAVAHGDYDKQLPVRHFDELGFLVQSFNDMTRRIARARDDVWHSQRVAESQRLYLETVLARLSSGVISLDTRYCLRTANPAACQILGLPLEQSLDQPLNELVQYYPELQSLEQVLRENCQQQREDWREEVIVFGSSGRKVLMCRGTHLQGNHDNETEIDTVPNYETLITSGYVVVFDDITTLIQAQRDAAWSEVARRMAHEIKNPLTPIQLSAERLRHKYLKKLDEADASTLDRLTYTIIQQVESMKEMVNAFSDYAKTPTIQKQPLQLKTLIQEVLDLYQHKQLTLDYEAETDLPIIAADAGKLRQILHNLIKNAMEATLESGQDAVHLRFQLQHLTQASFECVELRIYDQGPGIPTELLDKLFEPYVTTKTKGTGLGLAIVKKIIEEHGGIIWLENLPQGGACAVIRLPTIHQPQNETLPSTVEAT